MSPQPQRIRVLTVRLTEDELTRLDAFATRVALSRSEGVRQLLRVGLSAVKPARSQAGLLQLLARLDPLPRR